MARDPGSLWSPLKENGRQGSFTKTQFIVHSTGDRGTAAAIYNFFNRNDVVVESTFVVGRGPEDPTRQLLDSSELADANLTANQRGIAVEVVGTEFDDYTDWQVSEIIRLGRWARANHPIQPRICPAHDASGFGWHVMFGAPGPWTPVAKACPGKARIKRLQADVFPAIFNNSHQEDDLTPEQANQLVQIHTILADAFWADRTRPPFGERGAVANQLTRIELMLRGNNTGGRNNFHWLADQITQAVASIPGAKVDTEALREAIAASVTFTKDDLAKAVVDEEDRRERDGDPATGPVS